MHDRIPAALESASSSCMVGGNVASSDDMLLVDEDRLDGSGVEGVRNQDDGAL